MPTAFEKKYPESKIDNAFSVIMLVLVGIVSALVLCHGIAYDKTRIWSYYLSITGAWLFAHGALGLHNGYFSESYWRPRSLRGHRVIFTGKRAKLWSTVYVLLGIGLITLSTLLFFEKIKL